MKFANVIKIAAAMTLVFGSVYAISAVSQSQHQVMQGAMATMTAEASTQGGAGQMVRLPDSPLAVSMKRGLRAFGEALTVPVQTISLDTALAAQPNSMNTVAQNAGSEGQAAPNTLMNTASTNAAAAPIELVGNSAEASVPAAPLLDSGVEVADAALAPLQVVLVDQGKAQILTPSRQSLYSIFEHDPLFNWPMFRVTTNAVFRVLLGVYFPARPALDSANVAPMPAAQLAIEAAPIIPTEAIAPAPLQADTSVIAPANQTDDSDDEEDSDGDNDDNSGGGNDGDDDGSNGGGSVPPTDVPPDNSGDEHHEDEHHEDEHHEDKHEEDDHEDDNDDHEDKHEDDHHDGGDRGHGMGRRGDDD
jgi:hypothetical protein